MTSWESQRSNPAANKARLRLDRVSFEVLAIYKFERRGVAGLEDYLRSRTSFESLVPAIHTQAPAVPGNQTRELILGARRGEVVAAGSGEVQKLIRHHSAYRVEPDVTGAGFAKSVAVKSGHGCGAAAFQRPTENI